MELKITQNKDNALLGRKDISFSLRHDGETTPSRVQVRQLVAAEVGTKTENVVIDTMSTEYGMGRTAGIARAYKSVDEARKSERVHLLKRNAIYVEKAKKEGAKDGAAAEKTEKKADTRAAPAAKPAAAPAPAAKAEEKKPAAAPAAKAEKPAAAPAPAAKKGA